MLGNKKNKKVDDDQELIAKVNQDLLVRNMPSLKRLNSASAPLAPIESGGELLSGLGKPKHNFKAVGILIIFGGLILIGGLIYLSYIFIIKPQAKPVATKVVEQTPKTSSIVDTIGLDRSTTTSEISMATSSVVATVTPITIDLAASSASSTTGDITNQLANLPPLVDSDSDGLNDEEEIILGTNSQMVDSNSNSYADLAEINNGYNPAAIGKLDTNANLAKYTNKTYGYEILYPKAWNLGSLNSEATTIFTASDNSIIQISVQENADKQSILGWYGNLFPEETPTYDRLKSAASWEGIWGSDNLNFYLTDKAKKNIYVISLVSAVEGRVVYPNIFKLMIDSLSIK